MKRNVLTIAFTAAAALAAVGLAGGAPNAVTKLGAKLTAAQELPRPAGAARATGAFQAVMRPNGQFSWSLTYRYLTGSAVAAHVHIGRRGKVGPPIVTLCTQCGFSAAGTTLIPRKFRGAVLYGGAYVNVHTRKNAKGEIRGQIRRR